MTSSASDLESAQQYSLHRIYHAKKLTTNSGTAPSKLGTHHTGMSHSQSTGDVSAMFGRA